MNITHYISETFIFIGIFLAEGLSLTFIVLMFLNAEDGEDEGRSGCCSVIFIIILGLAFMFIGGLLKQCSN